MHTVKLFPSLSMSASVFKLSFFIKKCVCFQEKSSPFLLGMLTSFLSSLTDHLGIEECGLAAVNHFLSQRGLSN